MPAVYPRDSVVLRVAGRRRGGTRRTKVNMAETLRRVISASLTISCTDSSTEITIPRAVLEVSSKWQFLLYILVTVQLRNSFTVLATLKIAIDWSIDSLKEMLHVGFASFGICLNRHTVGCARQLYWCYSYVGVFFILVVVSLVCQCHNWLRRPPKESTSSGYYLLYGLYQRCTNTRKNGKRKSSVNASWRKGHYAETKQLRLGGINIQYRAAHRHIYNTHTVSVRVSVHTQTICTYEVVH